MRVILYLFLSTVFFFASQDDKNLEKSLLDKIKVDNNQPVKNVSTHEEVERIKRSLNGGMLPLSLEVKKDIVCNLLSEFKKENEAVNFFQKIAETHKLYPLSVEKTIDMIRKYYAQDIPPVLKTVSVTKACSPSKTLSEINHWTVRCCCLSAELNEVRFAIKYKRERKHKKSMSNFKIVPLAEIPLSEDFGCEDNDN